MGSADGRMRSFSMRKFAILAATALALSACSTVGGEGFGYSDYSLVRAARKPVGDGSMVVTAPRPWNRHRPIFFEDVRQVEDWTQNGPLLDGISFVTGLKDRKSLIRQRRTASQQVPLFRSNMTAPEVAAMIESLYRVRGGSVDFRTLSLQPRPFLGANGFQLDYEHLDDDELTRRGRAVGAVINGKLYMILLDAAKAHYWDAVLPDYEALVASAELRR
jgi:hypothetical protein